MFIVVVDVPNPIHPHQHMHWVPGALHGFRPCGFVQDAGPAKYYIHSSRKKTWATTDCNTPKARGKAFLEHKEVRFLFYGNFYIVRIFG